MTHSSSSRFARVRAIHTAVPLPALISESRPNFGVPRRYYFSSGKTWRVYAFASMSWQWAPRASNGSNTLLLDHLQLRPWPTATAVVVTPALFGGSGPVRRLGAE